MFYLPLAIVTWLTMGWLIGSGQIRNLLIYGLFGSVLATVQDRLVIIYRLWEYGDRGLVGTHHAIALLISLSAAPVFSMRFARGLGMAAPFPWRRAVKYTAVAMLPEAVGLYTGNVHYHNWWNIGWSVVAYLPIWGSIWALHRWLNAPAQIPAVSPPMPMESKTAPGT